MIPHHPRRPAERPLHPPRFHTADVPRRALLAEPASTGSVVAQGPVSAQGRHPRRQQSTPASSRARDNPTPSPPVGDGWRQKHRSPNERPYVTSAAAHIHGRSTAGRAPADEEDAVDVEQHPAAGHAIERYRRIRHRRVRLIQTPRLRGVGSVSPTAERSCSPLWMRGSGVGDEGRRGRPRHCGFTRIPPQSAAAGDIGSTSAATRSTIRHRSSGGGCRRNSWTPASR